jgi:predicted DsbA family dithiol-disulfide isomerase
MKLEFFADFTCPWCYIGLKRLQKDLTFYPPDRFEFIFVSYQLNPSIPAQGVPYRDRVGSFFNDPAKFERSLDTITAIGRELNIEFRFDRNLITTDTTFAHRLIKLTPADQQMKMIERLYQAIFTDAVNIANEDVLIKIIHEMLSPKEASDVCGLLKSNQGLEKVHEDYARSRESPIITVPYMLIAERYPVQACHLPEVMASCLRNME